MSTNAITDHRLGNTRKHTRLPFYWRSYKLQDLLLILELPSVRAFHPQEQRQRYWQTRSLLCRRAPTARRLLPIDQRRFVINSSHIPPANTLMSPWRFEEVPVVRNAGGRAMDAMRSLLVLDAVIGLGTIIVIHHTGKALYLYPTSSAIPGW